MSHPPLARVLCPLCESASSRPERVVGGFALERCNNCHFVFANPQYRPEALQGLYEEKEAAHHIALYEKIMTPAVIADFDRILSQLAAIAPRRGRLLDFGCASGHFVERALSRGWEAHGLDLSPWVQDAAAARGLSNVRQGTLADKHFPDGYFDVVHSSQVFEHLPGPKNELREVRRILRSGGLFYANVPNYRCLSIVLGRDDFELNTPPQHVNYFTPRTLRTLCETVGFRVLRTRTFGGLKWENLLGRPIVSEIANAYRTSAGPQEGPPPKLQSVNASRVKRLAFPLVDLVFYRIAQVGMGVEVFALKP